MSLVVNKIKMVYVIISRERESSFWLFIGFAPNSKSWDLRWQFLWFMVAVQMRRFAIWSNGRNVCGLEVPHRPHGGFTPCQIEHHVWTKFATPILHAIFRNLWYFFYIYITIDNIFCICFWNFSSSSFFVVIILIQFYVILVRNGMFLLRIKILEFGYHFLLCNTYCVYLLMKKIDKILTHFGDATYQN